MFTNLSIDINKKSNLCFSYTDRINSYLHIHCLDDDLTDGLRYDNKQLLKKYVKKDFNQETINELQKELNQFPFIKTVTTALAEKYNDGFYTINNSNGMQLYVNTGIGTSRIPARFMVPPEISVFNINL